MVAIEERSVGKSYVSTGNCASVQDSTSSKLRSIRIVITSGIVKLPGGMV